MILSDYDIQKLRNAHDEERRGIPTLDPSPNIIGNVTDYFFAFSVEGGAHSMTGMQVRILKVGPPPADPENDPFLVSLAIPVCAPGVYAEEKDIMVYSITVKAPNDVLHHGLVPAKDIDIVTAILEAQENLTAKKPGLQLVVNNPDTSTTVG